jgi:hypothetical protein
MADNQKVAGGAIRVEGLIDLQRELKAAPERFDKDLRKALKGMAEGVAKEGRSAMLARSAPRAGSRAAASIVASSSGADSRVSIGGPRAPHALGHEFGSRQGPHKRQFPPWSGNKAGAGYALWPAIRRAREDDLPKQLNAIIDEFAAKAFPD